MQNHNQKEWGYPFEKVSALSFRKLNKMLIDSPFPFRYNKLKPFSKGVGV